MDTNLHSSETSPQHHRHTHDDNNDNSNNDIDNNNNKNDVHMLLNIQSELYNMGKALSCPLCLSTVRSPVLLSCLHAFCHDCIRTAFQNHTSNNSKNNGSSLNKTSLHCPVCKVPCSKRSMVSSNHLEELVKGYKLALRSFGLAPVVYDKNVGMTQIEEEVSFSIDDYNDDDDHDDDHNDNGGDTYENIIDKQQRSSSNESGMNKKKPGPSLLQCYEHLEVSRAVRNVLKQAIRENDQEGDNDNHSDNRETSTNIKNNTHSRQSDSPIPDTSSVAKDITNNTNLSAPPSKKIMTAQEKIERENKKKKYNAWLKDQDRIFEVNQNALVRAAVLKRNQQSLERKDDGIHNEGSNVDNNDVKHNLDEDANVQNNDDDQNESDTNNQQEKEKPSSNEENLTQSQTFFSVADESTHPAEEVETESIITMTSKRQNLNDGMMTSQEAYEISTEDLREKEVADRSMEELENILEEELEAVDTDTNKPTVKQGTASITSQMSEQFFTAPSQNNKQWNGIHEKKSNEKDTNFAVGMIVHVQARTWPGVNKPGGAAKITKVHAQSEAGVKYDVSYILGGKEKLVDESFIRLQKDIDPTAQFEELLQSPGSSNDSTSNTSRRSRRVGERKMVERWVQEIDEEMKRNEESDKEKSPSVRDVSPTNTQNEKQEEQRRGITPTRGTKRNSSVDDAAIPTATKRRRSKSRASDKEKKSYSVDVISEGNELIRDLKKINYDEIRTLALKRYENILFGEAVRSINIITSSISNEDQKLLKSFCSKFSTKTVKIKSAADFHPNRTSLCITSPSENDESIAKLRTVKTMRAALAGIPIVSSKWISQCIDDDELKLPEENMFLCTLPCKESRYMMTTTIKSDSIRGCSATWGIFALGAQHELVTNHKQDQQVNGLLLEGASIYLCGDGWKKSPAKAKDVMLLLKESGANVLNSANATIKTLKNGGSSLVLLCDGVLNSTSSVFPPELKKYLLSALNMKGDERSTIFVVNSNWLFDCISCAQVLSAEDFRPDGKLAESLWQSCL